MSQSTSVKVSRISHVHQIPQTGRAHKGPVTRTTVQKTTPTSAATRASTSVRSSGKYFLIKKYIPVIARAVVATEDGSIPYGMGLIANAAMHPATPTRTAIHFAKRSAKSFPRIKYSTDAMKLRKNSKKAVQAEGTW